MVVYFQNTEFFFLYQKYILSFLPVRQHQFRVNPDKDIKLQAELDHTHRNAVSFIELRTHYLTFNCYEVIVFLVASIHRTIVLRW